jgi:hypothetical protein
VSGVIAAPSAPRSAAPAARYGQLVNGIFFYAVFTNSVFFLPVFVNTISKFAERPKPN